MRPARLRVAAAAALAGACTLVFPVMAAPPDSKLRDSIKASIDVGINWLRWQLDGEGTWRGDAFTTARAVRIFAESHRKYVEDDGPFMRRPVGYLRQALASKPSPVVSAAAILALAPLRVPADQPVIAAHAETARAWLAQGARMGRPSDLEQVGLAVMAVRAAGTPGGGDLLKDVATLIDYSTMDGPIPGFRDALRLHALLTAGAPADHVGIREGLSGVVSQWGWWTDSRRMEKAGYPVVPTRFWQALARALAAYGKPTITDDEGTARDWKVELARAIIDAQQFDGYWVERHDKIGDTISAVAALELIYRQ